MDGLHNITNINERIDQKNAKDMMMQGLGQRFGEKDPAAAMALTEIIDKPANTVDVLKKLFTPEAPQMSPEEQAMAQGMGPGGPEGMEMGPPPAVQTVLSQMETPGGGGGVMSVGRM